ncbi:MAG: DUF3014 domain-containing protein [Pseudomonadales bacterium]
MKTFRYPLLLRNPIGEKVLRADNQDRLSGASSSTPATGKRRSINGDVFVVVGVVAVLAIGFIAYKYNTSNDELDGWEDDPFTSSEINSAADAESSADSFDPEQHRAPAPFIDEELKREYKLPPAVPELNDSDNDLRSQLQELSSLKNIVAWSDAQDLARRFVVLVYNLAEGEVAHRYLPLNSPTAFRAAGSGASLRMSPASYARYDGYADAFAAMDAKRAVSIYQFFWPALKAAFAELGEPRKSLHSEGLKAIDHLLQTPVITGDVKLVQPSVFYKYADPSLERLSSAQKQMLRLGPRNSALIKNKLTEIKALLLTDN